MFDKDLLLELTESYLKTLIAEVSNSDETDYDLNAPFAELGIDSFFVLKIVKRLESDFGSLPKTLLFENFNIADLARYFVNKHATKLEKIFSLESSKLNTIDEVKEGKLDSQASSPQSVTSVIKYAEKSNLPDTPLRLPYKDALADPILSVLLKRIFDQYKNESSVSRGTKNIAPNLFIGTEQKGYFNYSRSNNIILAYAYTGPDEYFTTLSEEMAKFCIDSQYELNILTNMQVSKIGEQAYSATPFSVVQRVLNIQNFTLKGGKMRRLRYQVSKFQKSGVCRVEEFICGTDTSTTKEIINIIEQWCETRTMVNPLVHIAKEEIAAGIFSKEHRIFLTYIDDKLQNIVIISPLSKELNGYLMDLEFYPDDMPLGGLEFSIVNIIELLVVEGCTMLSLGATLGPKLESTTSADPKVDAILDELRHQNIFNDEGNLQFKNKFRPENRTIYLCRSIENSDPDNVIDIVMMIADPARMQTSDIENHNFNLTNVDQPALSNSEITSKLISFPYTSNTNNNSTKCESNAIFIEGEARTITLSECNYNPMRASSEEIEFDLKTDSWAQLKLPAIQNQMKFLHSQLQQTVRLDESLRAIYPFDFFAITSSGRMAEKVFFRAQQNKGKVLQNILFPTTIFHQIDNGFSPVEIPCPDIFNIVSNELFQGNLDWDSLKTQIETDTKSIALVYIEVSDNASGGLPVSLQHLKDVKSFISKFSIPLVLDGTRIIENAKFIIDNEVGCDKKSLWEVVHEICENADAVITSLAKDFGVNVGGAIATNDRQLFTKLQALITQESCGLDVIDKKLIALALQNQSQIEKRVLNRIQSVQMIASSLLKLKVPIVQPVGGHCILIDVSQVSEFDKFELPVASFVAWLFVNTGIRVGAHSVGMQKNTTINKLVRLAIPTGLKLAQVEVIIERLTALFENRMNIPELLKVSQSPEEVGDINIKYGLRQYHNVSGALIPNNPNEQVNAKSTSIENLAVGSNQVKVADNSPLTGTKATQIDISRRENNHHISDVKSLNEEQQNIGVLNKPNESSDIAIIGMAGRYPGAKNLNEMWENLVVGKDCIDEIPNERIEKRWAKQASNKYRGGFIKDVDKFDSLFFNISPREAEMLDPQERLFLEVAWETIEDAGYYPETLVEDNAARNIGVYVGAVWAMYQMIGVEQKILGQDSNPNSFLWSIANRVSYFLNFSGPSITIDTACSSSLTAIYLACEAINKGECSGAIVGGVNLDLHQGKFDINNSLGALSEDGVCRSFGKGADGYVAGEGIGALFLKPLTQAIKDGDNIHGVIKSTAVNHGGRNSGYTVPNPNAQADLIRSAMKAAKVDARTIGYIETHGTGTELGDPIEISGLTNAFESFEVENQTCSIGSIKSNIGHLEAAAGIVGVCKVLLQMKHEQLVPSIHSTVLNEHIDFEGSPFYVQQTLSKWKGKNVAGIQYPLRAGISSFGAGGSNAHIILEQFKGYRNGVQDFKKTLGKEKIFPLSAKSEAQLIDLATRLRAHLSNTDNQQPETSELALNDMQHTLQIGRKSFDYRLAILANTAQELQNSLTRYIDGNADKKTLTGHLKNSAGITKLLSRKEKAEFVLLLSQRRDPKKIAQLWVEGLLNDWQGFNANGIGRKISLPTYPFADKRHWVTISDDNQVTTLKLSDTLHPLIDSNESTFERQVFKKSFTEKEFFIYDHLVSDIPTLPGVAYLDFARKAGELATGRKVQRIKNILWVSPLTVETSMSTEALINLKPAGDAVQFEVFTEVEGGRNQLYSQGKIYYATDEELAAKSEFIDLESIRNRVSKVIDGKDAYPLFKSLGLDLGPSFQVLQEVFNNENEVLGVLKLPEISQSKINDFVLHPSLIDGSLQAAMAAKIGNEAGEMFVPYSIGEVEILEPLEQNCFSYVKEIKDPTSKVSKANVFILNSEGKVLVKIKESIGVPLLDVHEKPIQKDEEDSFVELYYSHVWEKTALNESDQNAAELANILVFTNDDNFRNVYRERLNHASGNRNNLVIVKSGDCFQDLGNECYQIDAKAPNDYVQLLDSLKQKQWALENICFGWPAELLPESQFSGESLQQSLELGVFSLLYLCQSLAGQKLTSKIQLMYLFSGKENDVQPQHEAINGFARALQIEHSKLVCKAIEIQTSEISSSGLLDVITSELNSSWTHDLTIRYEEEERFVRTISEFEFDKDKAISSDNVSLKQNGTYLITGGAGGLGLIFAKFLSREYQAKLVLTGRSAISEKIEEKLQNLRALGGKASYLQADVSNLDEAKLLVTDAESLFGGINGILHSAGVLRDSYIKNKTEQEMAAVFGPKVFGTYFLDEVTKNKDLDFFVTFSSMAAVGGNAGQSDYCFANHYMDSFARKRERLQAKGRRSGRSLSINWSLWADGGMKLDEQTELFFKKNLGIQPLTTETGLKALVEGLASEHSQFVVVEGVKSKIEQAWGLGEDRSAESQTKLQADTSSETDVDTDGNLVILIQDELAKMVVDFLKLDPEDMDLDEILLELGFDSIGLTTYANMMNEKYLLDVTPVLFFEYPSIREISKHLAIEHKAETAKYHQVGSASTGSTSSVTQPNTQVGTENSTSLDTISFNKGWAPSTSQKSQITQADNTHFNPQRRFIEQPIAVVGMSGVMPESNDLNEFWENLKNAKNMVSIIPRERWKWEDYDGDPLKEANKTNSKWGGFMKEVDKFDPLFFGISPREAIMMDPQQRIFLESVWKAVEDSGQKVSDLAGTKTGLFVGVATNDYSDLVTRQNIGIDAYTSTGNTHSVLVNRISFLLDITGPSAPFDTACSSSLVALHRALESIHTGSSDMAIVGGVQVMVSPSVYISFGIAGMLSSDGKCKTFDKRANGYVRGEGSGAIFLKPLSKAQSEGNHIYALIKSTAENHGGRVTTLTAPNPSAQTDLLVEAYEKAEIDPTSVGYIECHGTGTSLGDPIEIQALQKTFSELYKKHNIPPAEVPHIGLGSVKTNIGHLETAAGIAGILKVLLAIKHKQIPATLHFEEMNPYIKLEGSPFYIVDKTIPWEVIKDSEGNTLPRRAGVSSFGFGGANAHIVFEEYLAENKTRLVESQAPVLAVLSAKNEVALRKYAELMVAHLEEQQVDLTEFTYTLQVGRDEMRERLATVVSSKEELKQKLVQFIESDQSVDTIHRGNIRKKGGGSSGANENSVSIKSLLEKRDLEQLAQHWVVGDSIDWSQLYQTDRPNRISLPTYPFAREMYWLAAPKSNDRKSTSAGIHGVENTAYLHPLVQRNVSTLREQKFATQFTGNEFYFADHIVETQKILPGVAYMEMARVAGELAAEMPVRIIRDLVWARPIVITKDMKEIEVSLVTTNQEIAFAVKTPNKDHSITHCTGKLSYSAEIAETEVLDIAGIKQRCFEQIITGEELYPYLDNQGLKLGESFQIVQQINATESESLAVLKLPQHLVEGADDFWLHPALMDGSLHTAIGLMKKAGMELPLSLPVSVGEVQILHPLKDLHYGYATWAVENLEEDVNQLKANFQLLDKDGKVLVRMKDFVSKPFFQGVALAESKPLTISDNEMVTEAFFQNVWKESSLSSKQATPLSLGNFLIFDQTTIVSDSLVEYLSNLMSEIPKVILVNAGTDYQRLSDNTYQVNPAKAQDYQELFNSLIERKIPIENILHLWSDMDFSNNQQKLNDSLTNGVFSLLYISQAMLASQKQFDNIVASMGGKDSPHRKTKLLYIYQNDSHNLQPHHSAISGFGKSLALENSRFVFKTIELLGHDLSSVFDPAEILSCMISELMNDKKDEVEVRYLGDNRLVKRVEELSLAYPIEVGLKQGGCYIITGGLGGLGLIFAKHLAQQVKANLVLTGRSKLSEQNKNTICELEALGSSVTYVAADISEYKDVKQLIAKAKKQFNSINGIIHSAGISKDSVITKKSIEDMKAVFAAKIQGTTNLDRATENEDLDFLVLFSSLTSMTGNAGQSDYAFANSFMDNFAEYRNVLVNNRQRFGHTLSLNWPLWKEGGMQIDKEMEALLKNVMGIEKLETKTGLSTFSAALANNLTQALVMKGDLAKIKKRLGINPPEHTKLEFKQQKEIMQNVKQVEVVASDSSLKSALVTDEKILYKIVKRDMLDIVVDTLMINEDIFSDDVDMSEYGFDSVNLMKFFSEVNERYSIDLTPAVFFEYPTLSGLSQYVCEEYQSQLTEYFKQVLSQNSVIKVEKNPAETIPVAKLIEPQDIFQNRLENVTQSGFGSSTADTGNSRTAKLSIAIVGIAGVMPQSENLDVFWDNLESEQDLISEIPAERWNWREYLGNPVEEKNKTNSKWGGFMKEVDKFDPFFFGISPLEAELMDPQQRLFLETTWKAIEDAGHRPSELAGTKTGLFVGVGGRDYLDIIRDNKVDAIAYASTGNTHSILTNRISYLLDLSGPSEPIETACSSSLVAIHRAVEAISSGSCEMAIAGGVNVLLTPGLYLAFGNAGMLASDGRCKTFDDSANGYVRGEGCAAIFLKTLVQAEQDRNHIYGIVKGTGVNHGGHATSLTAPNPNAQANLLIDVYDRAQIDPNTIGYIEAHGTGTPLGDPVEINGLNKAFKELRKRRGSSFKEAYCGIGSVKTNIGHLETAAGIAGVIKILLSLKHKKLPGNIHFENMNRHIRLDGTPFYISNKTQPWNAIKSEFGNDLPRRAGVSSFSFGGANAHVILEEYLPPTRQQKAIGRLENDDQVIIPLSAKTKEQLEQKVLELLTFIQKRKNIIDPVKSEIDLISMAYTLQLGRDAMDERIGLVVNSIAQLEQLLSDILEGESNNREIYQGKVTLGNESINLISQDDEIRQTIVNKYIANKELSKLTKLWVKGLEFEWSKLYPQSSPQRMSLPTYPFARESYWVSDLKAGSELMLNNAVSSLDHPMLHSNTSDLSQQSYCSVFTGEENFLTEVSVINEQQAEMGARLTKILPAVTYLEMAREAISLAATAQYETNITELHDVIWGTPLEISKDHPITTSLTSFETDDESASYSALSPYHREGVEFEISCYENESQALRNIGLPEEVIHCQGTATFSQRVMLDKMDIELIKRQMTKGSLEQNEISESSKTDGQDNQLINQCVTKVYLGEKQRLLEISLPDIEEQSLSQFVLNPIITASAFQAAIDLNIDSKHSSKLSTFPLSLDYVRISSACSKQMYAWVRYSRSSNQESSTVKLDIDLMDKLGEVCLSFKGLTFNNEVLSRKADSTSDDFELLLDSINDSAAVANESSDTQNYTNIFKQILDNIY